MGHGSHAKSPLRRAWCPTPAMALNVTSGELGTFLPGHLEQEVSRGGRRAASSALPKKAPTPNPAPLTFQALGFVVQRAGFAAEVFPSPIDPDVHGLDLLPLRQLHVHVLDGFAQVGARRGGHGCGADEGCPAGRMPKPIPNVRLFLALPVVFFSPRSIHTGRSVTIPCYSASHAQGGKPSNCFDTFKASCYYPNSCSLARVLSRSNSLQNTF